MQLGEKEKTSSGQASRRVGRDHELEEYLADRRALIEEALDRFLPQKEPSLLYESMRYSLLGGGKRLRAILCVAAAETILSVGKKPHSRKRKEIAAVVIPTAVAIEMVHAMSLIHDDLPCLDNDDLRRGKPTNHRIYSEAVALLAGDALLMEAIAVIIENTPSSVDRLAVLDVVQRLARATGGDGMVGGQIFDLIYTEEIEEALDNKLAGERQKISATKVGPETVEKIHAGKTAALIRFSLWSGARLMNASDGQLSAMDRFGEVLGLAFQITDDLLDVTGDAETLGKTPGKDEADKKATWVTVFGVDGARARLDDLLREGSEILDSAFGDQASSMLSHLLEFAIRRRS